MLRVSVVSVLRGLFHMLNMPDVPDMPDLPVRHGMGSAAREVRAHTHRLSGRILLQTGSGVRADVSDIPHMPVLSVMLPNARLSVMLSAAVQ